MAESLCVVRGVTVGVETFRRVLVIFIANSLLLVDSFASNLAPFLYDYHCMGVPEGVSSE